MIFSWGVCTCVFPLQILSEKDRLVKRTQLKRSVYKILGKEETEKVEEDSDDIPQVRLLENSMGFLCCWVLPYKLGVLKSKCKCNIAHFSVVTLDMCHLSNVTMNQIFRQRSLTSI